LLAKDGPLLLPLLDLLENAQCAIDDLIDAMGRAPIEAILRMSVATIAGPKPQGKQFDRVVYHGTQQGRVALSDRELTVAKPGCSAATPRRVNRRRSFDRLRGRVQQLHAAGTEQVIRPVSGGSRLVSSRQGPAGELRHSVGLHAAWRSSTHPTTGFSYTSKIRQDPVGAIPALAWKSLDPAAVRLVTRLVDRQAPRLAASNGFVSRLRGTVMCNDGRGEPDHRQAK
jgi:hypothetical protein